MKFLIKDKTLRLSLLVFSSSDLFNIMYARFILKQSKLDAYSFMIHEQKAHQNDHYRDYLRKRKWFSFYKYLLPKNKTKMTLVEGKRIIF